MSRIKVYFIDEHKAVFDRDKVSFRGSDGAFFSFSEEIEEDCCYSDLVSDGRVMVNWDNVCFVREIEEEEEPEDGQVDQ